MYKLTTPTHIFTVNLDPNEWDQFKISYKQDTKIVLEKTEADIAEMMFSETDDDRWSISFPLTVEETNRFKPQFPVKIQIRCYYADGKSYASSIMQASVQDVLNKELFDG